MHMHVHPRLHSVYYIGRVREDSGPALCLQYRSTQSDDRKTGVGSGRRIVCRGPPLYDVYMYMCVCCACAPFVRKCTIRWCFSVCCVCLWRRMSASNDMCVLSQGVSSVAIPLCCLTACHFLPIACAISIAWAHHTNLFIDALIHRFIDSLIYRFIYTLSGACVCLDGTEKVPAVSTRRHSRFACS